MKKFYSLVVLLLMSLMIASCSKKDDNPTGPNTSGNAPAFPTITFKGPNTTSTDENAVATKNTIDNFNSFPEMLSAPFSAVQPTSEGSDWKWVVSPSAGATETFYATKNSDGSYSWKLILNGKVDVEEDTYNNWKAVDGSTSADGKNGSWKVYKPNTTNVVGEFSWTTSSTGTLSGVLNTYKDGVVVLKMEVTNSSDNSGSVKVYVQISPTQNAVITFASSWQSNGSGEWHSYDNGTETSSGSWQ